MSRTGRDTIVVIHWIRARSARSAGSRVVSGRQGSARPPTGTATIATGGSPSNARAGSASTTTSSTQLVSLEQANAGLAQTMRSGFRKEKMLLMRPFASLVRVLAQASAMRRTLLLVSVLLLGAAPASPAPVADATPVGAATFAVTGHGWRPGFG